MMRHYPINDSVRIARFGAERAERRDAAIDARVRETWRDVDLLEAVTSEVTFPAKLCRLLSKVEQDIAGATHADLLALATEIINVTDRCAVDAAIDYVAWTQGQGAA